MKPDDNLESTATSIDKSLAESIRRRKNSDESTTPTRYSTKPMRIGPLGLGLGIRRVLGESVWNQP